MSETDRRLKDQLNANQAKRERMCLEILSVQDGYTDLQPRLPKGGPDGGRDIQGFYKGELCFGAVGFVNDASDTDQHRSHIQSKFRDDLENALKPKEDKPRPKGFVFLTNVGLTPSIIGDLQRLAYGRGIGYCEILDRERLRIILDSNRGYAIRFRYLDISLSDAEQKDFFSAWADGITSLIGSGIKGIDQTTKKIQFLLESQLLLDHLATIVKLDAPIWEVCKGEFFFQTSLSLRVHSQGLMGFYFGGGTDEIVESPDKRQTGGRELTRNGQYGFGFSSIIRDTEQYLPYKGFEDKLEYPKGVRDEDRREHIRTASSRGILDVQQHILHFTMLSEPFLFRFHPTCKLLELHRSMVLFDCSKEIADHISEIKIFGGGYELLKLDRNDFVCEKGSYDRLNVPQDGKHEADSHDWITLRPAELSSAFSIDLMDKTPKRYDWS
jgi:hypothetical protein